MDVKRDAFQKSLPWAAILDFLNCQKIAHLMSNSIPLNHFSPVLAIECRLHLEHPSFWWYYFIVRTLGICFYPGARLKGGTSSSRLQSKMAAKCSYKSYWKCHCFTKNQCDNQNLMTKDCNINEIYISNILESNLANKCHMRGKFKMAASRLSGKCR